MANERASKRQQELLSFVDGFIKENGYGPSYREIMTALGYKSVSTVAIHVENLIAKGYLSRRDKSARSLEVVTTRLDDHVAKPASVTATQLQAELKKRLDAAELTSEQREIVAGSLALLGFDSFIERKDPADATKT